MWFKMLQLDLVSLTVKLREKTFVVGVTEKGKEEKTFCDNAVYVRWTRAEEKEKKKS